MVFIIFHTEIFNSAAVQSVLCVWSCRKYLVYVSDFIFNMGGKKNKKNKKAAAAADRRYVLVNQEEEKHGEFPIYESRHLETATLKVKDMNVGDTIVKDGKRLLIMEFGGK